MLEIILLVGYTIIFGGLYLIWKYWYISKVDKFTRGIEYIIFSIWLVLVILWNYKFPDAIPFEDVFIAVCLSLFVKSMEKRFNG